MKDKDLFHNIVGAEIPDWLQGRGFGKSGEELTILDDDGEAKTVMPGDMLEKCDVRGFRNRGNVRPLEEAELKQFCELKQYSREMKRKLYFGHLPEEQQRKLMP